MNKKIPALAAVLCAGALGLTGCSSDSADSSDSSDAANGSGSADSTDSATSTGQAMKPERESSSIALADGYCRAKEEDSDMTACFGTLTNSSAAEITVEYFTAPDLKGASTELHEVVDGKMRQKEGGFTIPANGSFELAPGGEPVSYTHLTLPTKA